MFNVLLSYDGACSRKVDYFSMRLKKRTFALLILALVLVSVYWSFKQTTNNTYSVKNTTKVQKFSSKVEQQISIHRTSDSMDFSVATTKNAVTNLQISTKSSNTRTKNNKLKLLQKILELEKKLNQSLQRPKVIFVGPSKKVEKEISLYKPVLLKHGHIVETTSNKKTLDNDIAEISALICHDNTLCLSDQGELGKLKMQPKVSYIPGLMKLFQPPHSFCYTMSQTLDIPVLSQRPLSVPCYVLPSKSNDKLQNKILESSDEKSIYLFKSSKGLVVAVKKRDFHKRMLKSRGILQVLNRPLLLNDLPVVVKLYILVTSISPLRVYRYLDGQLSAIGLHKDQAKETLTVEKFNAFVSEQHSNFDMEKVWSNVDRAIVNTLMVSESLLSSKDIDSSQNAFQILEFHFAFNSSLHPLLLEVKVPEPGVTFPSVANDTIDLLLTMTSSYSQVTDALVKLKDIVGVKEVSCSNEHRICLSDKDLFYVLQSHQESVATGRFKKLYPTHDSSKYQSLLDELESSSVGMVTNQHHGTAQLHGILLLLENYGNYGNQGTDGGMRQHVDKRRGYWETDDDDDTDDKGVEDNQESTNRMEDCDDDFNTVPVLTDILVEPEVPLNPSFDSNILEYEVAFPFDVMIVKLWGKTSTCRSEARVNSKAKTMKQPINYSLGVGWNKFVVHLINLHPRSTVVSTYKINIYRQPRSNKYFDPLTSTHEMCSLHQDCDLKTYPEMPCDPQILPQKTFQEFKLSRKNLPYCNNGHASGSWVFPCVSCNQSRSCYWNDAIWAPKSCQHKLLTTKQAKTCLARKKILFVGDSTNRGMMYYLMEKINGSLCQWEKTHSMKVYSSALNDDQTSVSFAYYPQFWLPSERKPVFLKALHHLMAKFMPLHNNTDTILVVGGVQWLLPSHVIAVTTTLNSLGLSGIKVLIKSLGSGFHLPVPGFVQLDKDGQRKVHLRNQLLIKTAKSVGFEVIDTLAMTVSRYKEFLMGKCGCHFHKVVNIKSQRKEGMAYRTTLDRKKNDLPRYHVTGRINEAYADIMISRICSGHTIEEHARPQVVTQGT